ncbi:MAG TPA: outer membrane beta-barrel protein [Terracidiphilus sp.]
MRHIFPLTAASGALALAAMLATPAQQVYAQSSSAAAPAAASAPAPAPAAAAPSPLPTPSVTGPLQWLPPATFNTGLFGKFAANGIVTGSGLWQGNHVPGDDTGQAALSNGQIFVQKPDGPVQVYVQVGAYTMPSLGTPFLAPDKTMSDFYGPVPVAFLKIPAGKTTSFQIGALPTLIGAEYTFTFENMNLERGLLWNQEPAISRGIQLNQTLGKYFSASVSWNDGYYSNRYSWLSGLLTFTKGASSLAFAAGGNLGQTGYQTFATPVQNNSSIYNVIYTYTKGAWIVQPYFQYSNVPTNPAIGVSKGGSTTGGAILVSRVFRHGFSLPGRFEYLSTSGSVNSENPDVNLLFGTGSSAVSGTLTPTYQNGGFYIRGDLSWVHASSYTPGDVFGPNGTNPNQPRVMAEIGFIFGNNLIER